jgi:hypothetical protein
VIPRLGSELRELPVRHGFPGNRDDPDQQPDELDQRE